MLPPTSRPTEEIGRKGHGFRLRRRAARQVESDDPPVGWAGPTNLGGCMQWQLRAGSSSHPLLTPNRDRVAELPTRKRQEHQHQRSGRLPVRSNRDSPITEVEEVGALQREALSAEEALDRDGRQ